jgi:hypothetical protein
MNVRFIVLAFALFLSAAAIINGWSPRKQPRRLFTERSLSSNDLANFPQICDSGLVSEPRFGVTLR